MELNEAVRRILGQHWLLILLVAFVPFEIVAVLHSADAPRYTASARLVMDTADPKSGPESTAIADTAKAIATSPTEVAHALREVRAKGRDPVTLAKEDVEIRALGTSGILQLSVTDPSAEGAVAIVNALAEQVIETRLKLTRGQVQETLETMDRRIEDINRRMSRLNAEADELVIKAATEGDAGRANSLRAERDETLRARDFLAQQRAVRESERVNLLSTLAVRPKPSVISPAVAPVEADASGELADLVLALLLGAVLGVGIAALKETLQPTLVGSEAVAAEIDAPLLGSLGRDLGATLEDRSRLTGLLRMSATAAHVRSVTLLPAGKDVDLRPLAQQLDADLAPATGVRERLAGVIARAGGEGTLAAATSEAPAEPAIPIRAFGVDTSAVSNGGATGLVVVAPSTMRTARFAEAKHLLRVSPAPLLGVVTYDVPRSRPRPLRLLRRSRSA